MKRVLLYTLSIILVMCLYMGVRAESSDIYAFVKSSKAYVYTASDMKAKAGTLQKFDIVKVESYTSDTACVSKSGKIGYMYLKDLTRVDASGETATVKSRVKVYTKPSTSSKGSYAAKGLSVNVIAVSGSWSMIEKDGNTGYIKSSYLTKDIIAVPTATPAPTDSVIKCDFPASVNVASMKVYQSADSASKVLGSLSRGAVVNVLAYNSKWAYIELNGRYGYCPKASLTKISVTVTPTPAPTQTSKPTSEPVKECTPFLALPVVSKVNVYTEPDSDSTYLGSVGIGTYVEVHGYNSTWAYISLNGNYGYARVAELTRNIPTATPTAVPTPAPTATPTPAPTFIEAVIATPTPSPTAKVYPESTDSLFTDTSTTNQQKAYLFISLYTDYNQAVACGLVSNFVSEASCNPKSVNSAGYRGICQWSPSRWSILEKWCNDNDFDPDSLEGQLKFLRYDLSQRYTVYHKYLLTVENTAQGAYDAGYYFCLKYERPGNTEASSVKRGNNAMNVYWPKFVE